MKVLLDECVTHKLRHDFQIHEAHTVEYAGMKGLKNGALLQAASGQYDVLVTTDQSIVHQQDVASFDIAVLILIVKQNTYNALRPLLPQVIQALQRIKPGEVVEIKGP